jgi:fucose permease
VSLLVFACLAFVGLGLPDGLPGAVWPELRPAYGLPNAALGLLLAAAAAGTFTASLLTGQAMARIGLGGLLAASLLATALTALGQALAPPWALLVLLAVLGGLGAGAIDAALNAFAALRFAPRHLSRMHACWGIGATLGPAIASAALVLGFTWQAAFAVVGVVLLGLAGSFWLTRRRWAADLPAEAAHLPPVEVLRHPVARRQILIFFLYVGTESAAGQWIAAVMVGRGASPAEAASAATLFWGALALGRIGFGVVLDMLGADRVVRLAAPAAALGLLGLAFAPAWATLPALALAALGMAPLYPTLMARTPARLGVSAARHAVGFQVAAGTAGFAVIPALLGTAADIAGIGAVPPLLALLGLALAWQVRALPDPARPAGA